MAKQEAVLYSGASRINIHRSVSAAVFFAFVVALSGQLW